MSARIVTREEAAKRLRCSMRTVERMLRDGRLGSVRRQDGRLSVDGEDLALVLANPTLLEERRASAPRERQDIPPEPDVTQTSSAVLAADARITPLNEPLESKPSRPQRSPRRPRIRAAVASTTLVVSLAATAAIIGLGRIGDKSAELAPQHSAGLGRTHTPMAISGGRAQPALAVEAKPASRGGGANTIAVRARRPQTQRPPITQVAAPRPGANSRVTATPTVHNCGFGSLTIVAC